MPEEKPGCPDVRPPATANPTCRRPARTVTSDRRNRIADPSSRAGFSRCRSQRAAPPDPGRTNPCRRSDRDGRGTASTASSLGIRVPHHRMDHRAIDAGGVHVRESFLLLQIRRLTVMGGWFAFGPEMDLCVNDHHGGWLPLDGGEWMRSTCAPSARPSTYQGGALPATAAIESWEVATPDHHEAKLEMPPCFMSGRNGTAGRSRYGAAISLRRAFCGRPDVGRLAAAFRPRPIFFARVERVCA